MDACVLIDFIKTQRAVLELVATEKIVSRFKETIRRQAGRRPRS
jgi:hypothetical protein